MENIGIKQNKHNACFLRCARLPERGNPSVVNGPARGHVGRVCPPSCIRRQPFLWGVGRLISPPPSNWSNIITSTILIAAKWGDPRSLWALSRLMSTLDLDLKVEDRLFRQCFYWFVAYVFYGSTYISEIEPLIPCKPIIYTHKFTISYESVCTLLNPLNSYRITISTSAVVQMCDT